MGGINLHHICTYLQKSILQIIHEIQQVKSRFIYHKNITVIWKNYVTLPLLSQHELQCSINSSYLGHKSTSVLTLSLLILYIHGAPSKARNLMCVSIYIYIWTRYFTGDFASLTFRNPASYIQDGHTATFNTPHFLYFFNKYTY
jgi:hypothetical protein